MKAGIEYGLERPTAADPRGFSIFDFNDYRKFLQAYYDYKKKRYYGFSYRSFNQAIEVTSPGLFLDLINGRQKMTERLYRKFSTAMKMNRQESDYFWLMIMLTHAKEKGDSKVKKDFLARMSLLKPSGAKPLTFGQESYLSVWHHMVVREALSVLDVNANLEEVAAFLSPEVTEEQIARSLALLKELGLIKKNRAGYWKSEAPSVTAHGSSIPPSAVHQSQKNLLDLSKRALDVFSKEERNISGMVFSISSEGLEKVGKAMDAFRRQVMEIIKADDAPVRVYGLSAAVFPLTQLKKESKP
jgi:uncharacterized protein (TIGR02147 family)